jgi:hypothetical protein
MHDHDTNGNGGSGLSTPMRNHYFYGQLLGVANLELETGYATGQRRLLNRLVLGRGVVCGLGVDVSDDGRRVRVWPGVAIDGWGREIVVPERTGWIAVPDDLVACAIERVGECRDDACVEVVICYHECLEDPVDRCSGDCRSPDPCAPSTIRERYRIDLRDECPDRPKPSCSIRNLIVRGQVEYGELARWVTNDRRCGRLPRDPCIALAAVKVIDPDGDPHLDPRGVDITVRPVLASNAVLMELVLALLERERHERYE